MLGLDFGLGLVNNFDILNLKHSAHAAVKLLLVASFLCLNLANRICHSFQNDSINFLIH